MTELTIVQVWLMLSFMALIFLSGICWCFCCGTCVGRSMLRGTGLFQWQQLPQDEEWHLQNWEEDE